MARRDYQLDSVTQLMWTLEERWWKSQQILSKTT